MPRSAATGRSPDAHSLRQRMIATVQSGRSAAHGLRRPELRLLRHADRLGGGDRRGARTVGGEATGSTMSAGAAARAIRDRRGSARRSDTPARSTRTSSRRRCDRWPRALGVAVERGGLRTRSRARCRDWPAFSDSPAGAGDARDAVQADHPLQRRPRVLRGQQRAPRRPLRRDRHGAGRRLVQAVAAQLRGAARDRRRAWASQRGRLLHVAQSLFHDHVPAKALGLPTVWIDRRGGTGRVGRDAAAGGRGDTGLDVRVDGGVCRRPPSYLTAAALRAEVALEERDVVQALVQRNAECPPGWTCMVLSAEPSASKRRSPASLATSSSSHWKTNSTGAVTSRAAVSSGPGSTGSPARPSTAAFTLGSEASSGNPIIVPIENSPVADKSVSHQAFELEHVDRGAPLFDTLAEVLDPAARVVRAHIHHRSPARPGGDAASELRATRVRRGDVGDPVSVTRRVDGHGGEPQVAGEAPRKCEHVGDTLVLCRAVADENDRRGTERVGWKFQRMPGTTSPSAVMSNRRSTTMSSAASLITCTAASTLPVPRATESRKGMPALRRHPLFDSLAGSVPDQDQRQFSG